MSWCLQNSKGMKYRLTCDILGMGSKGDELLLVTDTYAEHIKYGSAEEYSIYPHDIALLLHTGLLEEVKEGKIELWEEMPPEGTDYWFIDDTDPSYLEANDDTNNNFPSDKFRFYSKNMHKTRESAEEALRLIMES